ncbi:ATP-binding cassette domain-containing protein [Niveispirillum sp. KHB5.9]|uniref:ATP-binding cassette domain-containing protein n=1 Tax=Niveispirillum sp. KHB5.9 TaxID=3400269 RepID=UPI003A8BD1B4
MPHWLVAEGLCFAHSADRPLFDKISFSITDERVALVGGNGVGKSTLLRLLTDELRPERGHVSRRGRHFHWPQLPSPGQCVGDLLPADDPGRAASLSRFGLPTDLADTVPLSHLSGGQVARLRLAAIRLTRPDMLVLDEPGNDLDEDGRRLLADLVTGWRGGLLLVSHEVGLLSLTTRILDLSPLGLRSHGGGYPGWLATREAERQAAKRALADAGKQARQAREVAQQEEARASRRARAGKQEKARGSNAPILLGTRRDNAERAGAARRIKAERQAEQAGQALADANARLAQPLPPLDMAIAPTRVPAGRALLWVEELALSRGGRRLWRDLSFTLTGPTRLALTGPNGAGKSSLLDCLDGTLSPDAGRIDRAPGLRLTWLDQRLASASEDTPLSLARKAQAGHGEGAIRAALARFGFRSTAAEVPLRLLSGGMRVRAHLCAALGGMEPPHLLLLDEPANHLDLEGRAALLEALTAYDGALILVSHDPDFRRAVGVTGEVALG